MKNGVQVMINRSQTNPNDPTGWYYAGNINFFGLGSAHSGKRHERPPFRLIITNPLRRLSARRRLAGNNLTLTFVGRGAISPEGRQLPLSPDARVRVERVTLAVER